MTIKKKELIHAFGKDRIFVANLYPFFSTGEYWGDYKFTLASTGADVMIVDSNHRLNYGKFPFVVTAGIGSFGREMPENVRKVFNRYYRRYRLDMADRWIFRDRARKAIITAFADFVEQEIRKAGHEVPNGSQN